MKDWHSVLKNAENGVTLTTEQAGSLLAHIQSLETRAQEGEQYRSALSQEVVRLCALHLPRRDLGQCPEHDRLAVLGQILFRHHDTAWH